MKIEYPKALYHPVHEPRKVLTVEDHRALGPGWYESPGEAKAAHGSVVTQTLADVPEVAQREQLEAQAQYDAPIGPLVEKLSQVVTRAVLDKARGYELKHPKHEGGRKRVIAAIDEALAKLPA